MSKLKVKFNGTPPENEKKRIEKNFEQTIDSYLNHQNQKTFRISPINKFRLVIALLALLLDILLIIFYLNHMLLLACMSFSALLFLLLILFLSKLKTI